MDKRELAWEVLKLKYEIEFQAALILLTLMGVCYALGRLYERAQRWWTKRKKGGKYGQEGR